MADLDDLVVKAIRDAKKQEAARAKYEEQRWMYLRNRKKWKARKKKLKDWRERRCSKSSGDSQ